MFIVISQSCGIYLASVSGVVVLQHAGEADMLHDFMENLCDPQERYVLVLGSHLCAVLDSYLSALQTYDVHFKCNTGKVRLRTK